MPTITTEEITAWEMWIHQISNGYHMSNDDMREFLRLNHLVMEVAHYHHNQAMTN